jgi:hypothetical protein
MTRKPCHRQPSAWRCVPTMLLAFVLLASQVSMAQEAQPPPPVGATQEAAPSEQQQMESVGKSSSPPGQIESGEVTSRSIYTEFMCGYTAKTCSDPSWANVVGSKFNEVFYPACKRLDFCYRYGANTYMLGTDTCDQSIPFLVEIAKRSPPWIVPDSHHHEGSRTCG